ncbi:hypothetical protein LJR289_005729 [Pseudoduganella sp. LjRoot289]|uniref:hypothetical protein n=1 Tax=Pseudoduganella sp. LjRoot289 TaxID=3342314 RepID=UPI003ECCF684
MQTSVPITGGRPQSANSATAAMQPEADNAAVSWSAVIAGALAAAALSLILLILGVGLGLSAVSPWSYNDAPIGAGTILWLAFMQLASAGLGGYLAGRLRVRWATVHGDEVYFRDTAHGLLAWALATILTAALMAGTVRAVLSGAIDAGAGVAGVAGASGAAGAGAVATAAALPGAAGTANEAPSGSALPGTAAPGAAGAGNGAYYADMLLRAETPVPETDNGALRAEVGRILLHQGTGPSLAVDDRQYLARLIARRTGIEQSDAERRVDEVHGRLVKARADAENAARAAADKARKAGAHSALWMFVALLLGAFIASLAATIGGKQRDR